MNNNNNFDLLRPLVPNDKHYAMTQQMAAQQQQSQAAAATIATRSSTTGGGGLRYCQLPSAQVSSGSSSGSLSNGSGASVSTSRSGGSSSSSSNNSSPVPAPNLAVGVSTIGGKQLANIPNVAQQQSQSQPSSSSRYNLRPSQGPSIVSRIDAELQLQPSLAFTNLTPAATLALTANNTQASPLLTLSTTTNNTNGTGTTSTTLGDRQSIVQALLPGGSVPEFLYQLTKMLTTPTHKSIIEWSTITGQGRIEVHAPSKLESQILGKYFRHTKYSSFQRQLNYFGFRKIAGKGKMSPCSYINDNATCDIRSLLLMKRKNAGSNGSGGTRGGDRTLKEGGKGGSKGSGKKSPTRRGSGKNSSTTGGAKRGRKRKAVNPGNDIQPATVQPMFTTTSTSTSSRVSSFGSSGMSSLPMTQSTQNFNDMAASIAQNIASSSSVGAVSQQPSIGQPSSHQQHQPATASGANGQQGYTVAIGKGVKHQLNGYLRFSNKGIAHSVVVRDPSSTTAATGSSPTSGSSSTTGASSVTSSNATSVSSSTVSSNTVAASNNNNTATTSQQPSYLTHPSSTSNQGAILSAPAPLQFLDPSELGMSIENSLSQLKDNFAAAASASALSSVGHGGVGNGGSTVSTTAGPAAASMSAETSTAVSSSTSSSNAATTSSINKFNTGVEPTKLSSSTSLGSSGLTRRVTSTTYLGGMLSRDDSLINLAMLPTLDNNNSNALLTSNGSGGSNSNDSLVNLAASVETPLVAGQHNLSTTTDSSSSAGAGAEVSNNKSGGGEVWF